MKSKQIEAFAVMTVNAEGRVLMYHVADVTDLVDMIVEDFETGVVSVSIAKEILDETTQTSPAECL